MCGINGIMTASGAPPDCNAVIAMQAALKHRGPDGDGLHFDGSVGMAHRRLAIIDLETCCGSWDDAQTSLLDPP